MQWVKEAWAAVSADVIVKSFKKCGITNAMDGTEDEHLFNSDIENDPSDPFSDVPVPESPAHFNDDPVQLDSDEETDSATAEEAPAPWMSMKLETHPHLLVECFPTFICY